MTQPQKATGLGTIENDFLTPGQRLDAVAEILATIALRAVDQDAINQNHEDKIA